MYDTLLNQAMRAFVQHLQGAILRYMTRKGEHLPAAFGMYPEMRLTLHHHSGQLEMRQFGSAFDAELQA